VLAGPSRPPFTDHCRRPHRPQIRHSSLVERRAALRQLQSRAAELQAQLAGYHSLPPSMLGAGMMLQQARERLAAAQERLESGLADL
jgi:hypothetical protein